MLLAEKLGMGLGTRPSSLNVYVTKCQYGIKVASSPGPSHSFSMLHAEKREGLVSEITCAMSIVTKQSSKKWPLNKATVLG